jgi:WD40 repeat protein
VVAAVRRRERHQNDTYQSSVEVKLWNAQTGRLERTLPALSEDTDCVALSPEGKRVATGDAKGTLRIWNVQSGELLLTTAGKTGELRALAFAPDGKTLAGLVMDQSVDDKEVKEIGKVCLWDTKTGQLIRTLSAD